jgi:cob(I)alamin adenosyltransferase
MPEPRGLTIIHTGDGKGKTTAALGLALRAAGHGERVLIRQFIKGRWTPGEVKALERLGESVDLQALGRGFVRQDTLGPQEWREEQRAAREALARVGEEIQTAGAFMVILDEVLCLVKYGLVPEQEVLALVRARPAGTHLVLTGRGATPALIEAADLVTEMLCRKHPYQDGVKAQAGVEY